MTLREEICQAERFMLAASEIAAIRSLEAAGYGTLNRDQARFLTLHLSGMDWSEAYNCLQNKPSHRNGMRSALCRKFRVTSSSQILVIAKRHGFGLQRDIGT